MIDLSAYPYHTPLEWFVFDSSGYLVAVFQSAIDAESWAKGVYSPNGYKVARICSACARAYDDSPPEAAKVGT